MDIKKRFIEMKDWLKNTNWGELFFPVLADLKNINEETDTTRVSSNNWDLANDNEDFKDIIEKIKENRSTEETKHNIIIL